MYYNAITTMRQIVSKCIKTNYLQLEILDKLAHLQLKFGVNGKVNNPAVRDGENCYTLACNCTYNLSGKRGTSNYRSYLEA